MKVSFTIARDIAAKVVCALVLATVLVLVAAGIASAAAPPTPATVTARFPSGEPAAPNVTATAAILIDAGTGEILYSRNANARLPMASTTKIMTAIVVLETLDPKTKVKVSANAVSVIGSKSRLAKGEVMTVEELLHALLIISGNDAAVALAEAAGGSVSHFVEMMNEKAKELGLKNTHFVNPHGVNKPQHYSSAKDLATMAQYARKFPLFRHIVDSKGFCLPTLPGQAPRRWDSGNELVNRVGWVDGIKTGSTPYARYCLVASGTREGVSMISVVLGASTTDVRWNESLALLTYGFDLRPRTLLVDRGEPVMDLDVPDLMGRRVTLVAEKAMAIRLSKKQTVTRSVVIYREPAVPVSAGEVFGRMDLTLDGKSLGSVNLVAAQPVTRPTLHMLVYYWRASSPLRFLLR